MTRLKRLNRTVAGDVATFTFLGLLGAFMILPFVYAILQSFKPLEEIFLFPPRFFVRRPTIDNYYYLFRLTNSLWVPFSRYVMNSVFVTVFGTTFHVIFASMAAFPLAKFQFPGRNLIFYLVTLALLFTPEVTAIPQYIIMARLGMINTYWALLLPPIVLPLGLFLMRQFILTVPDSLVDAAVIDGAGKLSIHFRIIMPAVKPAWLTLIIFSFQHLWNREGLAFIYDESLKLLPSAFRQIGAAGIGRSGVAAAAAVILLIPPLVTFLIVQNNVIETMTQSGIK